MSKKADNIKNENIKNNNDKKKKSKENKKGKIDNSTINKNIDSKKDKNSNNNLENKLKEKDSKKNKNDKKNFSNDNNDKVNNKSNDNKKKSNRLDIDSKETDKKANKLIEKNGEDNKKNNIKHSSKVKKKTKNKKSIVKKILTYLFVVLSILSIIIIILFLYKDYNEKQLLEKQKIEYEEKLKRIEDNYNQYMLTNDDTFIYNDKYEEIGKVSKNVYLKLDSLNDYYKDGYYKLKNYDYYIKYDSLNKTEERQENLRYKNYVPFNKSIVTNADTKLFIDDNTYYIIEESIELPIIMDYGDKYYVSFDDKFVFVYKENLKVIDKINSDLEIANSIAVLNYHFVISKETGEDKICTPSSICHTDTQFDSHIGYIKNNGFYSITMKELEMFIDGNINLPKKSVSITIDDGWFVSRAIPILEKHDVMATLFLIGSLAPVSDYSSKNLEIHSHTWDLHSVSGCSQGRSALLCYDQQTLVSDLIKSRESLNNTTYFCYPFYEYNANAISALKSAGFTMALTGGNYKVTRGIDKFRVPRYVIYNTTTDEEIAYKIN